MELIPRKIATIVREIEKEYPVITLVGPRQSGKTILSKMLYPDKPYYSLENPDTREQVSYDPMGFLDQNSAGAIIDEFQRFPDLTSYLQQMVDDDPTPGRFILTGSQGLEVMDRVNQSLVGRSATVELLPFSFDEVFPRPAQPNLDEVLIRGLYPPIHHRNLNPTRWFANYVRNYLERDVRQLINIQDLGVFQRFLTLCAGRVGQLLNYSDIGTQLGVSHNTIKSWISVLQAHYIVFLVYPFFTNIPKRVVKTPKLYFYDTGLVSWLLSIKDTSHLIAHPLKGQIFECFCVSQLMKNRFNSGKRPNIFFWRDKSGHEIDVIIDEGTEYHGVEIKLSKTFNRSFMRNLAYLAVRDETMKKKFLVWGSDDTKTIADIDLISWRDISTL
jgi:uncharacterized protein